MKRQSLEQVLFDIIKATLPITIPGRSTSRVSLEQVNTNRVQSAQLSLLQTKPISWQGEFEAGLNSR